MRAYDTESIERRRTLLRTILFLIILGTIPCYLLGFWLWGTAPNPNAATQTPPPTNTPIGADVTPSPTIPTSTPFPSNTPFNQQPLQPTPFQFIPPPTRVLTDTPVPVIPTSTPAPTLTPNIPPTNTPLPPPTDPPVEEPPPVFTNPPPVLLPPTDTPNP